MGAGTMSWIMLILMLLVFWFLLIRPQRKREKQINAMRSSVKAGDKILTIGGIKARVIKDKEESLIIEVGDRVRMEVMRWAVSSVLEEGKGSVRKSVPKPEEHEDEPEPEEAPQEAQAEANEAEEAGAEGNDKE